MFVTAESILEKPSIKKHFGKKIVSGYPEKLISFEQSILVKNVKNLQSIWDYVSFDLIRNHVDTLEIVTIPVTDKHIEWIRENIKIESFLNMISTHYRKIGCIEIQTFINDTFNQLQKLLDKGVKVTSPKRWRLVDFHDHVSYLYLENTTVNNKLQTIITPYQKGEYTLSQPKNSLDIIIWGKKVKNCVASYEERIGKSLWIFFLEKDGVPFYTVETDMKNYHIKQIVSQCNGSVNSEGRDFAQNLIKEAIKSNKIKEEGN